MKMRKSKKTATCTQKKRRTRLINVQRHKASCGPIAIANLIKWYGIQTSYRAVLEFCAGIRAYHPRKGMFPYQMRYALLTLQIPFKVKRTLTVPEVNAILDGGGSIILIYATKRKHEDHCVFIDTRAKDAYRTWNRMLKCPPLMLRDELETTLRRSSARKSKLFAFIFQPLKEQK